MVAPLAPHTIPPYYFPVLNTGWETVDKRSGWVEKWQMADVLQKLRAALTAKQAVVEEGERLVFPDGSSCGINEACSYRQSRGTGEPYARGSAPHPPTHTPPHTPRASPCGSATLPPCFCCPL